MWRLNDMKCFGPDFEPNDEHVHILVELPPREAATSRVSASRTTLCTARVSVKTVTLQDLWQYSELQSPTFLMLSEITSILQRPLPFRMRLSDIAVTRGIFSSDGPVVSCERIASWLEQTWKTLNEVMPTTSYSQQQIFSTLLRLVEDLVTARGFTLGLSFPEATSKEDRPDVFISLDRLLLFRGEIQRVDIEELDTKLISKMRVWNPCFYGDLPYILGFTTSTPMMRIVAIDRNLKATTILELQSIFVQKVEVIKALYNLAFVLGHMRMLSHRTCLTCLSPFSNSSRVKMLDDRFERTIEDLYFFKGSDFEPLAKVYRALRSLNHLGSGTTHLQTVLKSDESGGRNNQRVVVVQLGPLGHCRQPVNATEAREWLYSMLTALKYWNGKNYWHGDICWRKILYTSMVDPGYWFLVITETTHMRRKKRMWNLPFGDEKLHFKHDLLQLGLLTEELSMKIKLPEELLVVRDTLLSVTEKSKLTAKGVLKMIVSADNSMTEASEKFGGFCRLKPQHSLQSKK